MRHSGLGNQSQQSYVAECGISETLQESVEYLHSPYQAVRQTGDPPSYCPKPDLGAKASPRRTSPQFVSREDPWVSSITCIKWGSLRLVPTVIFSHAPQSACPQPRKATSAQERPLAALLQPDHRGQGSLSPDSVGKHRVGPPSPHRATGTLQHRGGRNVSSDPAGATQLIRSRLSGLFKSHVFSVRPPGSVKQGRHHLALVRFFSCGPRSASTQHRAAAARGHFSILSRPACGN
ncbi:hypothetical protein NDU88_003261 [Pleurodeles waltl]|uniref:Uncharacterized protein n=1 Tax=Pleurodeles waltl TaxID=8319 RepID=A0AAV7M2X2_PLEWA|nr:hypothetical protein NDU88_003261 [Pleurodeles waltl]